MFAPIDIDKFRKLFPQFANALLYPPIMIQSWYTMATCSMAEPCVCLTDDCGTLMLYLMTAHLGQIMVRAAKGGAAGGAVGVLTSATIDKVTVTYTPPPFKDGWQAWMASTPYGLQLWAMLSAMSAGGYDVNGRPEQEAFRGVYGGFW